ncbi:eukaryotic translation initiation factor 1A, X-chromosomal-like, partial [Artibeus jamaicensis]|uniref:eukaryotic translation initiation factor 1A, X-chromosomal-like n=1 Tax=Artibeus jamaicensis TaxID=9417 RepID=UPI00235B04CA
MPKNKGKGGKNRRRGKNENESEKRELVFKEDGQEYAQVIKMLGNGRLEAMCFDGVKRLCHIRGKLRKKVWINTSDIILIGLRDYQVTIIVTFHCMLVCNVSIFLFCFFSLAGKGRREGETCQCMVTSCVS